MLTVPAGWSGCVNVHSIDEVFLSSDDWIELLEKVVIVDLKLPCARLDPVLDHLLTAPLLNPIRHLQDVKLEDANCASSICHSTHN